MQSKAEDEGKLAYPKGTRQWAYVEDNNAAMRLPGRRTCLDIYLDCYRAYVEDNNAAMRLPGRRTCLDIYLDCYS